MKSHSKKVPIRKVPIRICQELTDDSFYTLESFEQELIKNGLEVSYSISEEGKCQVIGFIDASKLLALKKNIKSITVEEISEQIVNWIEQMHNHCHTVVNDKIVIDLFPYLQSEKQLFLEPGAAFGDLTHPTTRLMLDLMSSKCSKMFVVDIGTGSAILAMAAILFGASRSWGLEIDPEAIILAKKNIETNHLKTQVFIGEYDALLQMYKETDTLLLLANMIRSELFVAMDQYPHLFEKAKTLIVSGIRSEEKKRFFNEMKKKNWHLQEEKEEDNWVGALFVHR